MRVLVIAPAQSEALPALRFLPHAITQVGAEMSALARVDPDMFDVAVVDATLNLQVAATIRQRLDTVGFTGPAVVVLGDGGFTAAQNTWGVADIVSTHAQPSEIDARLRLAHAGSLSGTEAATPGDAQPMGTLSVGGLTINHDSFTVSAANRSISLTYKEFELLHYLVTHPDRAFTRSQLVTNVWGSDYLGGSRTVDVHVRRLRAKLGPEYAHTISTVRNVGYMFSLANDSDGHSE